MITSDAITWNAPNDPHPARAASQRSYSAVAKGDLAEWLTVYAEDRAHYVFRSSITGKAIERASVAELEDMLRREYPDVDLDAEELDVGAEDDDAGRWEALRSLLVPLENLKQSAVHHPEGDVLYHLLQVFELAREQRAAAARAPGELGGLQAEEPADHADHGVDLERPALGLAAAELSQRGVGELEVDRALQQRGALDELDQHALEVANAAAHRLHQPL